MTHHLPLRLAVALLAPLAIMHPAPTPAATPAGEMRMPHISVVAMGKGPPVILIPGLASPRAVWDGIVPELAKTRRVYLVQVNGFAGDDPGANLTPGILDGIVADLHALIAKEKMKDPAIIGHSMGGLVGLMLAKAHPGDVGKLMIVDSLPYVGALFGPTATVATVEPQARTMRDRIAATYGKPRDPAAADAQTKGMALKPASIAKMKSWAAAADPRVTAQAFYEDMTTDLRPDLAAIGTPITLVYPWNAVGPTKERAGPFYRAQYAGVPRIAYVDIGDAAHFVMLDQPEAFATAVTAFLAS